MKVQRQQALLDLVARIPLGSQREIRDRLERMGHPATQSTVSRDLEELGLVRVRDGSGRLRYTTGDPASGPGPTAPAPRLRALLAELAVGVDASGNLAVVHTLSGAANAVAEAIDRAGVDGVLATVAGDNTILVVAREGTRGRTVAGRLRQLGGLS